METDHSQYSSPVEEINLTIASKSLSAEVNNSTSESCCYVLVEAKEKLAPIDSKCRSLVQANLSNVKSNGSLHFEANPSHSHLFRSSIRIKLFLTIEIKEYFFYCDNLKIVVRSG